MAGSDMTTNDARSLAELRERVTADARELSVTAAALRARADRALDWRAQASRHPYVVLAAAAGAGLIASRLLVRRSTPTRRALAAVSSPVLGVLGRAALGIIASRVLGGRARSPFARG